MNLNRQYELLRGSSVALHKVHINP